MTGIPDSERFHRNGGRCSDGAAVPGPLPGHVTNTLCEEQLILAAGDVCSPSHKSQQLCEARLEPIVSKVIQKYKVGICFVALKEATDLRLVACQGTECRRAAFGSIAHHWISRQLPIIIENAQEDGRFVADPLVAGPTQGRFYAGAPLMLTSGVARTCLGTLCIMDAQAYSGFSLNDCGVLTEAAQEIAEMWRCPAGWPHPPGCAGNAMGEAQVQVCSEPNSRLRRLALQRLGEPSLAGLVYPRGVEAQPFGGQRCEALQFRLTALERGKEPSLQGRQPQQMAHFRRVNSVPSDCKAPK